MQLAGYGMDGIAVISGIFAQPDIEEAAHNLKNLTINLLEC